MLNPMDQADAPMLFHIAFTTVIITSIIILFWWGHKYKAQKDVTIFICFFLIQVPAYWCLSFCPRTYFGDSGLLAAFGSAGIIWAISVVILMYAVHRSLSKNA